MTPVTPQERQQQLTRLAQTPMEKEARRLLNLAGLMEEDRESASQLLSLMIWGARQVAMDEEAETILRMDRRHGPMETARKLIGRDDPVPMMQAMGPQEAAEQLMAIAADRA